MGNRKCTYRKGEYLFHGWFQEGSISEPDNPLRVIAIVERLSNGRVEIIYQVNEISFDATLNGDAKCQSY